MQLFIFLLSLLFFVSCYGIAVWAQGKYEQSEAAFIVDSPDWNEKDPVKYRRVYRTGYWMALCSGVLIIVFLVQK